MTDESRVGVAEPAAAGEDDTGLEALWRRVEASWDDDKTHAALLEYAIRRLRLMDVAARYRALAGDPQRGEAARRRMEAVAVAASQLLLSTQSRRRERIPLPITLTAFAICVVLLAWVGWMCWR